MNEAQLGGIAHGVELNDEDSNYNDLGLGYKLPEDDDENMEYGPPDRNKDDKAENDRDDNQESGFYLLDCDDDVDMTQVRPVSRKLQWHPCIQRNKLGCRTCQYEIEDTME